MSASLASLMYTFLGLPLAVILVLNLIGKKQANKLCTACGVAVGLLQMISAALTMSLLLQYNKGAINFSQFWDMSLSPDAAYFSADVFSLVALFAVGMVTLASFACVSNLPTEKRFNYTNVMMTLILGMNGVALVTDLFSLYVFVEVAGVSSFVLIVLSRDNKGLEGGFKYLVMSAIASVFLLLALTLLFLEAGSLRFDAVSELLTNGQAANPALYWVALIALISGLALKAGLVPFHGWLPDAYQSAPAPVSVILGGVVTKMVGVYAIIRILCFLMGMKASLLNSGFMLLALASILVGALAAIGQDDLKRILAYSSISQIGYIVLGAASGNMIGLVGALLHFFNHATFKSTLFVNAAALERQAGTTEIAKLGGLQKQMPITSTSGVIAFLSAAGIPPLAGFWSKLLIIIAAWTTFGGVVGGTALLASVLTCAYFLRLQRNVFFGPPRDSLSEVREAGGGVKLASILLTIVTCAVGVLFPVLLQILQAQGLL